MAGHGDDDIRRTMMNDRSITITHDYDDDARHSDSAPLRRAGRNVSTGRRPSSSSLSSSPGPHSQSRPGHTRSHSRSSSSCAPATTGNVNIRVLFLLVALVSLAWSLYQLPLNRVIERRLCAEYYRNLHDGASLMGTGLTVWDDNEITNGYGNAYQEIPEEKCKVDEVQRGLGRIQGFMEAGWVAGDFFMTIPLIAVADRYGHGMVLLLNLVPRIILLAWTFAVGYFDGILPVNIITVAPLFSVMGGDCVFNSIVYSLVSGSTDDVVLRATYFGQMNAVSSIFAYQLGPALASASMSVLLWLPLWLGILLLLLAMPTVARLKLNSPSTRIPTVSKQRQSNELHLEEGSPLLSASSSSQTLSKTKHSSLYSLDIPELMHAIRLRFLALTEIVTSYPLNFTLLLGGFFLTSLASSDTKLLTQYISKRYNWKFTSVGYLLSGKAVFNFCLLYFLIPALLRWREGGPRARRRQTETATTMDTEIQLFEGQSEQEDDKKEKVQRTITHAHICLVFSVLGAMAIGSSATIYFLVPSLLLYALGIALPMFTYSLLKADCMLPPSMPSQSRRGGRGRTPPPGREDSSSAPSPVDDQDGEEEEVEPPRNGASTVQIFSIVMLVKQSGMLVGAPLMASLWVYGLGVGGIGLGLPYFVSATCYAAVVFIFRRIRV
ncbi:hypothetical protein V8F06_007100 [Rhypophila decipiens]